MEVVKWQRRTFLGTSAAAALIDLTPTALKASEKELHLIEGQRRADQGNGTYINPILSGDRPDPSVLKDGKDYYLTCSSFESYPGLLIWHSVDLVNWQPRHCALVKPVGSVWAPELIKYDDRYYIYFATKKTLNPASKTTIWVVTANHIDGPWSDPIDLGLANHIDPGHAVDEMGNRYLFLSGGDRVSLSNDGLSTTGPVEHVYDPWRYPDEWIVEGFSPEGPKVLKRGAYYYLILAIGGTAGPPTGHMVIAARSKSIHGPWDHHPQNPLVRTKSMKEQWWSRGHATLIEGPNGDWWGIYHGYENGYWTLGRQALLDPVRWDKEGWFHFTGGDLSKPLKSPSRGPKLVSRAHGLALSDEFKTSRLGQVWMFLNPSSDEADRLNFTDKGLVMRASGEAPSQSSVLTCVVGDRAYECDVKITTEPGVRAGLILIYDQKLYAGLGYDHSRFITHQYGIERGRPAHSYGDSLFIRLRNDHHIVSLFTSKDGINWKKFDRGMEVSGYHHNVRGGFMMLRPGLYACGNGKALFSHFRYRAL